MKPWTSPDKNIRARDVPGDRFPIQGQVARTRREPDMPLHMQVEETMRAIVSGKKRSQSVNNFFGTPGRPSERIYGGKSAIDHGNFRLKDGTYLGPNWDGETYASPEGANTDYYEQMARTLHEVYPDKEEREVARGRHYAHLGRLVDQERAMPEKQKKEVGTHVYRTRDSIRRNQLPESVDGPRLRELISAGKEAGLTPEQLRYLAQIHVIEGREDHGVDLSIIDANDKNRVEAFRRAGIELRPSDLSLGRTDPRRFLEPTERMRQNLGEAKLMARVAVATFLEGLMRHNGDARAAVRRYNGAGPMADQYLSKHDELSAALQDPANSDFRTWLERQISPPTQGRR